MKHRELVQAALSFDNEARQILLSKNHDYADGEDALSNAKKCAAIIKILKIEADTPHGFMLVQVVHKLVRKCNLLFNTKQPPQNEPIKETYLDDHNYIKMSYFCWLEWLEQNGG